jgi:hypothetical protein
MKRRQIGVILFFGSIGLLNLAGIVVELARVNADLIVCLVTVPACWFVARLCLRIEVELEERDDRG